MAAGAIEACGVDQGFQQHGGHPETGCPVRGQTLAGTPQNVGGEVGNDPVQVLPALRRIPADIRSAILQCPTGRAEGQATEPAVVLAAYRVTQLRATRPLLARVAGLCRSTRPTCAAWLRCVPSATRSTDPSPARGAQAAVASTARAGG